MRQEFIKEAQEQTKLIRDTVEEIIGKTITTRDESEITVSKAKLVEIYIAATKAIAVLRE